MIEIYGSVIHRGKNAVKLRALTMDYREVSIWIGLKYCELTVDGAKIQPTVLNRIELDLKTKLRRV